MTTIIVVGLVSLWAGIFVGIAWAAIFMGTKEAEPLTVPPPNTDTPTA